MKNLFLLTTGFPFPAKSMETYLETETKYYGEFNIVNILAMGVRKNTVNQKRDVLENNVHIYPIVFASKIFYVVNGINALFDKNFYREILKLCKQKKLTIRRLIRLIIYISRSHSDCRKIVQALELNKRNKMKNAVLYSYRFEYQPYVMFLLKDYFENPKIVARAHRYDLYEESNSDSYIPLRELLLDTLDKVYLISEDGKEYLSNKFPEFKNKLSVSRLGTLDYGIEVHHINKCIKIVSCSNLVPVKRVDRIIDVLSCIKDISIEWIHFGGGELAREIEISAEEKLSSNIRYLFLGKVENRKVLEYYKKEDIDLFINLSESEGIPVSIMEAMSFGIPCIATDVGGTREIVVSGNNGWLLENGYTTESVAKIIRSYSTFTAKEILQLRNNAREYWNQNYNADQNYREFIKELLTK